MRCPPSRFPSLSLSPFAGRLLLGLVALLGVVPSGHAAGQAVMIQISPKSGDTLEMRMEQRVEVTGTARGADADSAMAAVTTMIVHSRTIVQRADATGTTVLTITDSVTLSSNPPQLPLEAEAELERGLRGQQVRMRIAHDGAAEVLPGTPSVDPEIQAFVSQIPAALPSRRVGVGERWTHTMQLPAPGSPGLVGSVSLKTTFRLDSLGRNGRMAFISMRGELSHADEPDELPGGALHRTMTGSLEGYLIVDRERGWLTQSMSTLMVHSVIEPPKATGAPPMDLRMRITQRIRTLDKR